MLAASDGMASRSTEVSRMITMNLSRQQETEEAKDEKCCKRMAVTKKHVTKAL